MNYAFVTAITKKLYIKSAIKLAWRFNYLQHQFPFIILITENILNEFENQIKNSPIKINYQVVQYKSFNFKQNKRYNDTLIKFQALQLVKYEKIIFLDADCVLYKNIDHWLIDTNLTDTNFLFPLSTGPNSEILAYCGIFFMRPNLTVYKEFFDFVHSYLEPFGSDEHLISQCFSQSKQQNNFIYDLFKNAQSNKIKDSDFNSEIMHFPGLPKIWDVETTTTQSFLNRLINKTENYDDFNTILDRVDIDLIDMSYSNYWEFLVQSRQLQVYLDQYIEKEKILDYLEVHITDHCNLNCASCTHYSPLAEKNFVNITRFKQDFIQLATILKKDNIKLNELRLLGGEPLQHPNLIEICTFISNLFKDTRISVVTNGILLQSLSQDFCDCVNKNNISICWSNYHLSNEENIRDYLRTNINLYEELNCNYMYNPCLNLEGKNSENINSIYHSCPYRNCLILRDGFIYHCPNEAYIDKFINYFNLFEKQIANIDLENSLNIYTHTGNDILKFFDTTSSFCKFCSTLEEKQSTYKPFNKSQKKINEWIINE